MTHARTREFETLWSLVGAQYTSDQYVKYPILALLGVLQILDEYWDTIENEPESVDDDFPGAAIDAIEDMIHMWLVHQIGPEEQLTDAERTAMEDQWAADLREQIENFGRENGIRLDIQDLDQQLFKKEEEEDGDK